MNQQQQQKKILSVAEIVSICIVNYQLNIFWEISLVYLLSFTLKWGLKLKFKRI